MTATPLITLEIPRHLNDQRVDSALATLLEEKFGEERVLSRTAVTRQINSGVVLLNGKQVLSRVLVKTHDLITLPESIFEKKVQIKPLSQEIAVEKLFENDSILVLNKGAGVQMHEGGSYQGGTVAEWLFTHYPDLVSVGEDSARPGIVHRLDRDTSGVLVVAKDVETFQELKTAFQNRQVAKTYVALVYGHLKERTGEVSASLMRNPGELKRRAVDPETYTGTLPGNTRTALTHYRVIARFAEYDLVELSPKTGRTHQIRVHLSYLGHPVVGDRLYAFKEAKRENMLSPRRHLLHAAKISFSVQGQDYQFQAPLPQDFQEALQSIDETRDPSYDDEALKSLF